MHIWLSEFTYQRLVEGLGEKLPILHTDERGFNRVDIPDDIVNNAISNFGSNIEHAINETINHNQKEGLWPKKGSP